MLARKTASSAGTGTPASTNTCCAPLPFGRTSVNTGIAKRSSNKARLLTYDDSVLRKSRADAKTGSLREMASTATSCATYVSAMEEDMNEAVSPVRQLM